MRRELSLLALIILLCNITVYQLDTSDNDSNKVSPLFIRAQLTNHSPIVIGTDSDFETQGWPGEGTLESPYTIESLRISGEKCILIENTTAHFSIKDCELIYQEINSTSAIGITIKNATYGSIELCNITGFEDETYHFGIGIALSNSRGCKVKDTSITDCPTGFHLYSANDTIIENNDISTSAHCIRTIIGCANVILRGNSFQQVYDENTDGNLFYGGGWNWTIDNNDITGHYGSATYISLFGSELTNNRIDSVDFFFYSNEHVLFSSNTFETSFMTLSSCRWNTLINNHFGDYTSGIFLQSSNHSILYENKVYNDGDNVGDQNGYNNTWDDGVSQGNAWSDYNGTGVYEIPGSTGSVDRYPRILETSTPISSTSTSSTTTSVTTSTTTSTPHPPNGSYPPDDYTLIIVIGGISLVAVIAVVVFIRFRQG